MKKKLLVVLLAMAMVLCFAATALAAEESGSIELQIGDDAKDAYTYLLESNKGSVTLNFKATASELTGDTTTEWYTVNSGQQESSDEENATRKVEKDFVVIINNSDPITITSNQTVTNDGQLSTTSLVNNKEYKATLYYRSTTSNKVDNEWVVDTSKTTLTKVDEDSVKVSVVGGLDSAYINRSKTSSSSKIDTADLKKATDTLEIDSKYSSYDTFYLHLEAAEDFTITKVESKTVNDDSYVYEVDFSRNRTEEIDVTVEDKGDNSITYTFTVKQLVKPYLDDLTIRKGSTGSSAYTLYPSFDKDENDYSVFIPYESGGRYIYIDADPDNNSEAWYGNSEISDRERVTITKDTTLTIKAVDDIDDDITNDYKVSVYYAGSGADDDADLDGLDVETSTRSGSGYKDATVSKTGNTYNVYVSKDQEYARITLDKSDRNAYIIYNDEVYSSQEAFSGLALKDGKNTFTFVVMAEDCETTETYTVNIYLGVSSVLADLTATGFVHEMTPDFDADQNVYIGYVANKTSSTTITAEAADEDAKIYIYSETDGDSKTGTGKAYDTFKLKEGLNNFRITVATSSSSKDYTYYYLSIYRQPAKTTARVSNQTVTVNGRDKDLYCYNINGNNFIQLRDFAYIMKGQDKQFNVEYTSNTYTANLTSGEAYTGERTKSLSSNITIKATTQNLKLDGESIYPMAYNINGNNYIMLRDLCALLDIGCTYSSTSNSISLNGNSSATYTPQN